MSTPTTDIRSGNHRNAAQAYNNGMRNETTGLRIKFLRDSFGLSQDELAERMRKVSDNKVDVSKAFISSIEVGRAMPPLQMLIALAKVFGTTTDYILMLSDDSFPAGEREEKYLQPEADECAVIVEQLRSVYVRQAAVELSEVLAKLERRLNAHTTSDVAVTLKLIEKVVGSRNLGAIEKALRSRSDITQWGETD